MPCFVSMTDMRMTVVAGCQRIIDHSIKSSSCSYSDENRQTLSALRLGCLPFNGLPFPSTSKARVLHRAAFHWLFDSLDSLKRGCPLSRGVGVFDGFRSTSAPQHGASILQRKTHLKYDKGVTRPSVATIDCSQ